MSVNDEEINLEPASWVSDISGDSTINSINNKVRKSTKNPTKNDFWAWLTEGINKGYCSDMYCENHDATARNDSKEFDELIQKYDGRDFCWSIVHVYYGVNG